MSRVGKKPVVVTSGVTASVEGQTVKMKGPKGQLQFIVHDDVERFRPVRIFINTHPVVRLAVAFMSDCPLDIRPGRNAVGE